MAIDFEWDDAKAAQNEQKHGVTFDYATRVFTDRNALQIDATRLADNEVRNKIIGAIDGSSSASFSLCAHHSYGSSRQDAQMPKGKNPMATIKFTLDPNNDQPKLSPQQSARLDAMTEAEIERNAASDPDNPPMADEELDRAAFARFVRQTRERLGLTQSAFAERFQINLGRLRDWEQGRFQPDSVSTAYMKVIALETEAVERALGAAA